MAVDISFRHGLARYRIVERRSLASSSLSPGVVLVRPSMARSVLRVALREPELKIPLRRLYLREFGLRSDVDEDQLIEGLIGQATEQLGHLALLAERRATFGAGAGAGAGEVSVAEPRSSEALVDRTHSLSLQVVLDHSGEPVAGVALRVSLPDGREQLGHTDANGSIELRGLEPGAGGAASASNPVAARASNIWHVVGVKPAPIEPEWAGWADAPAPEPFGGTLAVVEDHAVADGETLSELAGTVGASTLELARFNWGSRNPAQIQRDLRERVGCTKLADDGSGHVFCATDEPGLVLIPRAWSAAGLATNQGHVIRVRRPWIPRLRDWDFSI
ncbi:hypothetical protein ENSA5_36470 [Enhygromyxa salina]|uniref:LysM domain-containing protein n=1 Tax=Enhygromyxa salina TaxID=215803 RepID=A0A2S9XV32_9BACT|nr:carboxypeptidase-like regulatory domain-containing protein [Enhygromyxa salina]PRP96571.1 hypothetical protein ENSA5_36470 [Enhygromyxa salina]